MKSVTNKISVVIIIVTMLNYNIAKADNNDFFAGAVKVTTTCDTDGINVEPTENNDEKFFRPSKLPLINNNNMNDIISQYFDPGVDKIVLSKDLFKTPEDTIKNYFSLLREAANPVDGKGAGCGTLGNSKIPYKIAYRFLTDDYRSRVSFPSFEKSFENILHINLLKVMELPTDTQHANDLKFFYEIETIEGTENQAGSFSYYYGYIYLTKVGDEYKISDITITPENFLCAPYHGWKHDAQFSVGIRYGNWCKLIDKMGEVQEDGYVKNIFFKGTDGKDYKIQFITLTSDSDIEVAQYVKDSNGKWQSIHFNPDDCVKH